MSFNIKDITNNDSITNPKEIKPIVAPVPNQRGELDNQASGAAVSNLSGKKNHRKCPTVLTLSFR